MLTGYKLIVPIIFQLDCIFKTLCHARDAAIDVRRICNDQACLSSACLDRKRKEKKRKGLQRNAKRVLCEQPLTPPHLAASVSLTCTQILCCCVFISVAARWISFDTWRTRMVFWWIESGQLSGCWKGGCLGSAAETHLIPRSYFVNKQQPVALN